MKRGLLPSGTEVAREVIVILAASIGAAAILYAFPRLRRWIREADKP